MKHSVSHDAAKRNLQEAVDRVKNHTYTTCPELSEDINFIILGTHLTYRYVLLTGVLSKATNPAINPLVMQAKSELPGAFDARSVCHNVVVKQEKDLLGNRLGASNEPYLNKPARFPEMSKNNAVRRGNDQVTRDKLVDVLTHLQNKDQEYSFNALCTVIEAIFERPSQNIAELADNLPATIFADDIRELLTDIISESWEGQSSALVTGLCYSLLRHEYTSNDVEVKVHPANQAGSSSREVLDIDIYQAGSVQSAIEVKDKDFSPRDVEHAVRKSVQSGLQGATFIIGPQARLTENTLNGLIAYWRGKNIALSFLKLDELIRFTIYIVAPVSSECLLYTIQDKLEKMKAKDELKQHILSILGNRGWL